MALTYNQVSALTHRLIAGSLADAVYDSNPLFLHLKEKNRIRKRGGREIDLPIVWKKNTSVHALASGYDLIDTTPVDNITAAAGEWVQYVANMTVSNRELALNGGGEVQVMDLLDAKMKELKLSLEDKIGTDLFSTSADAAGSINGLRGMVAASGTLHKVATGDFAGWVSDIDAATSVLVLSAMQQQFLDASIGKDEPDIIVTNKNVYKKYWTLLQATQRFGSEEVGKGGFRYLLFNGVPVFHDSHCPGTGGGATANNHMFFLNSRWLYLYVHSDWDFKSIDIPPVLNQSVKVTRIETFLQFMTDNRRMHSAFTILKA